MHSRVHQFGGVHPESVGTPNFFNSTEEIFFELGILFVKEPPFPKQSEIKNRKRIRS